MTATVVAVTPATRTQAVGVPAEAFLADPVATLLALPGLLKTFGPRLRQASEADAAMRAHAAGMPASLETATPRNLPLYERHARGEARAAAGRRRADGVVQVAPGPSRAG